jgi:prepilin-type N-terminal cleavage/methylation domain-containing protein
MERPTPVHSDLVTSSGSHRRSGFTLVELLAVIMIIALLAGLLTPAVIRSLSSARTAAVKAEIDLLHMAVMNYKNEYGSFPPSRDFVDNDGTPPFYALNVSNGVVSVDRVRKHLRRLFPRMDTSATAAYQNELLSLNTTQAPTLVTANGYGPNNPQPNLYENNALYFWLAGYSDSPTNPFSVSPRKKLYDFDMARLYSSGASSGLYAPAKMKDSPYLYRDSGAYFVTATIPAGAFSLQPAAFLEFNVATSEDANANGSLDSGEDRNGNNRIDPVGEDVNGNGALDAGEDANGDGRLNFGEPFNKDTFQIMCAGKDGTLGTDDDLSNFWKGTRKDYLDSLK